MSDSVEAIPKGVRVNALNRLADRASDRFNPILVKELRQAVRGRLFPIAFGVILLILTMTTVVALLSSTESVGLRGVGRGTFLGMYTTLGIALFGLVPFASFASLGGEWEENTFDLLVLSLIHI